MTLSITKSRTTKTGDGATTVFDIADAGEGIYFAAASEINVQLRVGDDITAQTQGTHYTVSGAGSASGQVTFGTAPSNGVKIDIWRSTPLTQSLSLTAGGRFDPSEVMGAFDRVYRVLQEQRDTGGASSSTAFDDDKALTLSPGGTEWDAESKRIENLSAAVAGTDAVTYTQLLANITSSPVMAETATGAATIAVPGKHLIMANGSAATVTIASGIDWCLVSRSSQSAANVTVVSADGPTVTIEGDGTGVVINAQVGPVWFIKDPADANNYITVTPTIETWGTSTPLINKTVAELASITPTAGLTYFATDGRKGGEGSGAGTGVMVFGDGTAWRAVDTGATVAA